MATMKTRRPMMMRLGLMAALAVISVLVVVVVTTPTKSSPAGGAQGGGTDAVLAQLDGIPQSGITLGSPKAPVTIVEFADLQCPFCAEYERNVMPTLLDRYVRTGKVRLELRLLRFLGPDSDRLARVAAAAATKDRMWQYVALAYERQVRRSEQAARTLGIESTPSFLIGPTGGPFERFQPSDLTPGAFIPRIDRELRR